MSDNKFVKVADVGNGGCDIINNIYKDGNLDVSYLDSTQKTSMIKKGTLRKIAPKVYTTKYLEKCNAFKESDGYILRF